jgi:hypothetical protein
MDVRMERAELEATEREARRQAAIAKKFGAKSEIAVRICEYFIKLFPFSISGVGVKSESEMMSGAGRKRTSPSDSDVSSVSDGFANRVSKKQAIETLTTKMDEQHNSTMNYMRQRDEFNRQTEAIRYENEDKIRREAAASLDNFQTGFLGMFSDLIKKIN